MALQLRSFLALVFFFICAQPACGGGHVEGYTGPLYIRVYHVREYKGVALELMDIFGLEVQISNSSRDSYILHNIACMTHTGELRPLKCDEIQSLLREDAASYVRPARTSWVEISDQEFLKTGSSISAHGRLSGLLFLPLDRPERIVLSFVNNTFHTKTSAEIPIVTALEGQR